MSRCYEKCQVSAGGAKSAWQLVPPIVITGTILSRPFLSFGGFMKEAFSRKQTNRYVLCSCAPVFKFFFAQLDGVTIEYEISNRGFFDFVRTYHCDFLSNVYR